MEKALHTTNKTVSAKHIKRSVGSACHNLLCSTNIATNAHMAAISRMRTIYFIGMIVGKMLANAESDDGKRY